MRKSTYQILIVCCIVGSLLAGCAATGPKAIHNGRLKYNEAIAETNSQQMLLVILHNRYAEESHLLAVASVTANVGVKTGAGFQLGIGDAASYAGNLVPFSASTIYEENPTISYVPVGGQQYLHQLTSPVSIAALAQLTTTLVDPAPIYGVLVSSVNGIYNPDFLYPSVEPDPRFNRFVMIMTALAQVHRLHWFEDPPKTGIFSVVISDYAPTHAAEVAELLDLLDLPVPGDLSQEVVLPVSLALNGRKSGSIGITTRSVMRLMEILSASVELPHKDEGNATTIDYPLLGPVGRGLRIRYAEARPDRVAVAVQYRDGWFYIDDQDKATKQFFRLLGVLWSVSIAESTDKTPAAPILTVPVSR